MYEFWGIIMEQFSWEFVCKMCLHLYNSVILFVNLSATILDEEDSYYQISFLN